MSDGHVNKRITDLERTVARVERKINHLESRTNSPRQEHQAAITPEQNSQPESQETPWESAVVVKAPEYSKRPHNERANTLPWWRTPRRWWPVVGRIGIVAGIVYAVVTFFEWRDLRNNFIQSERPWVLISKTNPERIQLPNLKAEICYINYGKTPATHFVEFGKIFVGRNAVNDAYAYLDSTKDSKPNSSDAGQDAAIPPGFPSYKSGECGYGYSEIISDPVNGFDFLWSLKNEGGIVMAGWLRYEDVHGTTYSTEYCRESMPLEKASALPPNQPPATSPDLAGIQRIKECPTHNDVN